MRKGRDIAWLAGFIDGEGCFTLVRHYETTVPTYGLSLKITNTSYEVLCHCGDILKNLGIKYTLSAHWKHNPHPKWKQQWCFQVHNQINLRKLCELLKPHLILKRPQCALAIEYLRFRIRKNRLGPKRRQVGEEENALIIQLRTMNVRGVKDA